VSSHGKKAQIEANGLRAKSMGDKGKEHAVYSVRRKRSQCGRHREARSAMVDFGSRA